LQNPTRESLQLCPSSFVKNLVRIPWTPNFSQPKQFCRNWAKPKVDITPQSELPH